MSTAKLTVFDGSNITAAADLSLSGLTTPVTGPDVLQLAESRASASLLGASLPEPIKSAARRRISVDIDDQSFNSAELSKEAAVALLVSYITAIADELKGSLILCVFLFLSNFCGLLMCLVMFLTYLVILFT